MSKENSLRPQVGTGIYILNEKNQLLLTKRVGALSPYSWCPQGGHLEFGETFLDCAKREIKEEVGLDISGMEIIGITNDFFETEGRHYVTIHMKVLGWSGEPKIMEPDKCLEIDLFDLDKLPQPLLLSNQNFFASNPLCFCNSGKRFKECHGKKIWIKP